MMIVLFRDLDTINTEDGSLFSKIEVKLYYFYVSF